MFLGTGLTDRDYTELVTHALNNIALSTLQELYRKTFFKKKTKKTALTRFKFNVALRPQSLCGLLGTGSPRRPPRLPHSSWVRSFNVALRPRRPQRLLGTGSQPRTATLTFTQFLSSVYSFVRLDFLNAELSLERCTWRRPKSQDVGG